MMVRRWTKAATKDLRDKISRGEINPNIQTVAYLGDVVSGEHCPNYKAPPPAVMEPLLSTFVACSGTSGLSRNHQAIDWQKEKEKKVRIHWL